LFDFNHMGYSILVVDDDPFFRRMMEHALEDDSRAVLTCESADEAHRLLNAAHFDLVVTDNSFAGMSGLELIQRNAKRAGAPNFIMISGSSSKEVLEHSRQAGAMFAITKPVPMDLLEYVVKLALTKNEKVVELPLKAFRKSA
jgi:CheY-like chemotaxis protein